jgi:hypothetical protein
MLSLDMPIDRLDQSTAIHSAEDRGDDAPDLTLIHTQNFCAWLWLR